MYGFGFRVRGVRFRVQGLAFNLYCKRLRHLPKSLGNKFGVGFRVRAVGPFEVYSG